MQDSGVHKKALSLLHSKIPFSCPKLCLSLFHKHEFKFSVPVPFHTMEIKQRQVIVVKAKRIIASAVLDSLHHIRIRQNFIIKGIVLHPFPSPSESGSLFTILYSKYPIYYIGRPSFALYYTVKGCAARFMRWSGSSFSDRREFLANEQKQ